MNEFDRIFVAVDGGRTQEKVIRRALRIAANHEAELLLGHVVDTPTNRLTDIEARELATNMEAQINQELRQILDTFDEVDKIPSIRLTVAVGRVQETLLNKMIKPFKPDLVVCGERGLANLTYAFVGSTSTHLIRHVTCDVLVVKQR